MPNSTDNFSRCLVRTIISSALHQYLSSEIKHMMVGRVRVTYVSVLVRPDHTLRGWFNLSTATATPLIVLSTSKVECWAVALIVWITLVKMVVKSVIAMVQRRSLLLPIYNTDIHGNLQNTWSKAYYWRHANISFSFSFPYRQILTELTLQLSLLLCYFWLWNRYQNKSSFSLPTLSFFNV